MDPNSIGYALIPGAVIAACSLARWLAYLLVIVIILFKTGKTEGFRDLGAATQRYRGRRRNPGKKRNDEARDAPDAKDGH